MYGTDIVLWSIISSELKARFLLCRQNERSLCSSHVVQVLLCLKARLKTYINEYEKQTKGGCLHEIV